jgi:hypothetical protein
VQQPSATENNDSTSFVSPSFHRAMPLHGDAKKINLVVAVAGRAAIRRLKWQQGLREHRQQPCPGLLKSSGFALRQAECKLLVA